MGTMKYALFFMLISCYCFQNIRGNPVGTSVLDCTSGGHKELGPVDEGFNGIVEEFTGVTAEQNVQLSGNIFPSHINYLELTISGSTATIRTKNPLDADAFREAQGKLYYSLQCGNGVQNTRILLITDINDNSPVFGAEVYNALVFEALPVGSPVLTVFAVDADATEQNNRVTYSILPPLPSDFEIMSDGRIILTRWLNYNVASTYSFTVEARDNGNRSDTALVNITVSDFDNMNPYFNHSLYTALIKEHQTGEFLSILPEAIQAKDGDSGINQPIVYSISAVSPSKYRSHFSISQDSGVITVVSELDREEVGLVTVNIKAAQNDDSLKTAEAVVSVAVEDVNDNPPEFDKSSYSATVLENSPVNSLVLTARVTDRDEGGFSGTLRIIPEFSPFSVSPDGTVWVENSTALDREKTTGFVLQVVAVDSPTNGLSATAQLNITILDVNDNNPQFLPLPDPIQIAEGHYTPNSPGEVCQITATDADEGVNGKVTMSLSKPSTLFTFREDGTLLAVGALDREGKDTYDLEIVASDNGTPQRKTITDITVTIADVNDHNPKFSQEVYTKDILVKDAKEGDLILTLSATDKDSGNNSLITYSFTAGSSLLKLNSETGEITLTSDLSDITEDTLLNLTALAQDHGQPPRNSTATVLVSISTISLTPGVDFESSTYNFSVAENEPEGTMVGEVKAVAGSALVQITYSLRSHNDLFSVDKQGKISTIQVLDQETQAWYNMEVEAVDSRDPPNTAIAMVMVQVQDVNEPPEFTNKSYYAKIVNVAPYKYHAVQVKATDLDLGDNGLLEYSLDKPSPLFDVDPSTGQVYVVSVEGEEGLVSLRVKATDPRGLSATTDVEVMIQKSISSDVVVISLNQPANIVEKNIPEMERSLKQALGWTVKVISITSSNTFSSGVRSSRDEAKTYVFFISMDENDAIIPSTQVESKLQSERETVTAQLETVFGPGLEFQVEEDSGTQGSSQELTIIALSVALALCILGLPVLTIVAERKLKKVKKDIEDAHELVNARRHSMGNISPNFNKDESGDAGPTMTS